MTTRGEAATRCCVREGASARNPPKERGTVDDAQVDRLPRKTRDPLRVAPHGLPNLLARLGVPQPHRVVHAPRRDLPLESVPLDAQEPARVARERRRGRLRIEVPQTTRVVAGARREEAACRGERGAEDRRGVACAEIAAVSARGGRKGERRRTGWTHRRDCCCTC